MFFYLFNHAPIFELECIHFCAVWIYKDKEVTLALVVYVDHQGSLENQEIMAGMDSKE